MKLRLAMAVVILFLLILILPFFVSQVESGTSTNTYYPSNYNLSGSTQLVSGSLGNLQSDDGNYMIFRSYPNYDFRFGESLGESSWNTDTNYQDKVVLTFTPPTSADYIVLATAEVQGDCISPPDVKARFCIGGSTYQELIYRIKDTTDWYPFCALKRISLPASSQTLKIQYAISATTLTAKIRNARLYVFSLSSQYAESEGESTSTSTNWQDKVALTFTPSTSGDYLIIATANYGGSSTDYSTLLQFLKDGSVQAGPTRETSASEARYTFGVMRKINLDATLHTFKIQYKTESTLNTARIKYAHIVAIRIDQFSNNYYTESESESAPAAINTTYDKVTNTYTAQAADHLIIGSISYKAGSTSYSVGVKLLQGGTVDQSLLVEHKDSTDYESCFMMAKASLSAGSVTDKIQYYGESTSARVKNARLISLQLPTQHTVEVEFTGSSNTDDWTQLVWAVDSAWTTPSVTVTLQLYNYNLGQYPTSGDGYILYTSSATSNTDETKSQTITTNPTHFRDGSGNWKIKVKGIKSTTTQFDFKADLIKFEVTYTPPTVRYYLTVKTDPESIVPISGEGWYNNCTYVDLTAPLFVPNEAGVGGERCRFANWTVDGNFVSGNAITVYMDANHTAVAHYVKQYKLIMSTNFGTTSPSVGSCWYDVGSVVSISATAPSVGDGEQYVWLGWTGTGTISYTGINNLASVTMNSPVTETAAWRHEYRLTMAMNYGTTTPSVGDHWYVAGTVVPIQAFAPSVITGEQYVWNGWTGTGTVSYTGTANPSSVTINSPISETASWTHQFLLTIRTSGLPSAYPTKVYLAGSQVGSASDTSSYTKWFDAETPTGTIGVDNTISGAADTRYVFVKWVEDSSTNNPRASETMDSPKTFTAEYKTQYQVSFTQTGSGVAPTVTYTADTDPIGTVPFGVWVKAGSEITYVYQDTVLGTPGVRYVLIGVTLPSPQTVNSPLTISGSYKTQYYLTVSSLYGTTGGENWYNSGDTAYATLNTGVVEYPNGTRKVFTGWGGDASGIYYAQSDPILMDGPKTAVAAWKTQYKIIVRTSGLGTKVTYVYNDITILGTATDATPYVGWFDKNTVILLDIDSPIVGSPTRYVFTQWTGDALGSGRPVSVTLSSPKDITANYKTQYQITVTADPSGALGGTFKVTYTQCGTTYTDVEESTSWTDWADAGTTVTVSNPQDIINGGSGIRYKFDHYDPSSSVTMDQAKTITLVYKTQYQITVTASPAETLGGTFKVTYTQYGITYTNVQKTTSWIEWADAGTTVTVSEPQDIINSKYKFDHYDPAQSVTMSTVKTVTLFYRLISGLSVSISPPTSKIKVGESVAFTSTVSGGEPSYHYQWYVNGSAFSGATSSTWTFTPETKGLYIIYLNVTDNVGKSAKSNEASVTVAPKLTVSISPTGASIVIGQSVTFTSTPSGGYPQYSYQWYLGGSQVSGATSASWTFTPTTSGIYYVYLQVKDANNNIVQSETARITVIPPTPVGGYSISLVKRTPTSQIAAYTLLIALFGAALSLRKRKRK